MFVQNVNRFGFAFSQLAMTGFQVFITDYLVHVSKYLAFHFVRPRIDLCPFGGLADGGIIGIMSAPIGGNQPGDAAHDLVSHFIQLSAALAGAVYG